jgi:hypothetical protein
VLEPVYYVEHRTDTQQCMAICRGVPAKPSLESSAPFGIDYFNLHCMAPERHVVSASERSWRRFLNFNHGVAFARIPGYWPTHYFAHYPSVYDSFVLGAMETDFADLVNRTRHDYVRTETTLWWTMLAPHYATAHRLQQEWRLLRRYSRATAPVGEVVARLHDLSPHYADLNEAMGLSPLPFTRPGGPRAHRLALKKLNAHLVNLHGEKLTYYFCMAKRLEALVRCRLDLSGRSDRRQAPLLITINDDFDDTEVRETAINALQVEFTRLLGESSNDAPRAPWELH